MKNIGIVGARKYKDRQSVIELVHSLPKDSIIITSSCRGVCTWAGKAARVAGLGVRIYVPDLTGIENRADMLERYYRRNRELISACVAVHAFISQEGGLTGGTRYEVQYAKRLAKQVVLHWENGNVQGRFQQARLFDHKDGEFSAGWLGFFAEALARTVEFQWEPSGLIIRNLGASFFSLEN